jgi:hypothetical protein
VRRRDALGRLAFKTGSAYAVVRAVRALQARAAVPGDAGLTVAGVHVHHYLYGAALLAAQAARRDLPLTGAPRANATGIGLALVLDELDLLLGCQAAVRAHRRALDTTVVLSALALAWCCGTRSPSAALQHWVH